MKLLLRTACLLVLVVTSMIGASARFAMAMDSDAVTRARLDLSQECQPGTVAISDLSGASCDAGEEIPAQQAGCPMINVCLNMGTGTVHCGLVTVTDVSIVPAACTNAVPAVFSRSAVLRSGLVADPILQPPIL